MPNPRIVTGQAVASVKLERAKELRRQTTPEEAKLWRLLRTNRLGLHFRRQQVIAGFIVDFYCHQADLVVEVDGAGHQTSEQVEYDAERDQVLSGLGLRVLRIPAAAIRHDLQSVLEHILVMTREQTVPQVPPSLQGRGTGG